MALSRGRLIATAVAAAVIGSTAGGFTWLRGGSTPVPAAETVRRYRFDSSGAVKPRLAKARVPAERAVNAPAQRVRPAMPARGARALPPSRGFRPLPPPGVYSYATKGHDEVDALGGSRHTYPPETTITVRHAGCGLIERWDALEERWDERESCRSPRGDRLVRVTSFHEFFRQADQRTLRCDGLTYPAGARPGQKWTMRCDSDTTKSVSTLRAIGYEDVVVDGKPLRALRVRVDTKVSGEQDGEGHRDVWGAQSSGLVLREVVSLTSTSVQPAIGSVTYHEEYELRLTSLTPSR